MLITQYAAAKQAGVSKQTINAQLKKVPKPLYFVEMKNGWKIDDDHQLWKAYVQDLKINKGKISKEEEKFNRLLKAVVEAIKNMFNPGPEELSELLGDIDRRFKGGL